jgi:hypothetical protein
MTIKNCPNTLALHRKDYKSLSEKRQVELVMP